MYEPKLALASELNANGDLRLVDVATDAHDDIATILNTSDPETDNDRLALAERIIACLNACQGIPTEALNAGLIPHLMVMGTDADQMVRELSGTYIGDRIPGEIPGGYDQWNRFSDAAEAAAKILKAHPTK